MSSSPGDRNIDVGSIWLQVRTALPSIAGIAIAVGALTFAVLAMMAPRYEAETQLTITAKSNNPYRSGKNEAGAAATLTPRLDPAAINTHVRALMAPDLLLGVGRVLGLGQRAEFNSAIGPIDMIDRIIRLAGIGGPRPGETVESRVLAAMRANLTVSAARESRFISVRFTSIDPQIAADIANGVATAYRNSLREIPVRETDEAVAVLMPKIAQLNREVFEAEAIAKRFRAETDQLTGGSTSLTLAQQRLATLNADLVKAEADMSKSEARLTAARELATRGGADTLPEVQQSRIIQDLIAQRVRAERQLNEAEAVLLPAHPRMRQLNADLAGLRRALSAEIRTIVNSISKEVRLAQLRTEQMRKEIAALKQNAISQSGNEAKLRSLETIAVSKRNELEGLQKQLEDNRTVVDTNRVPVESNIVSGARASGTPVFPKKIPYTLLAMMATFMLGLAVVIARALMASGGPVAHDRRASDQSGPKKRAGSLSEKMAVLGAALKNAPGRQREGGVASAGPLLAGSRPLAGEDWTATAPARAVTKMPAPTRGRRDASGIAQYAQQLIGSASGNGGHRLLMTGVTDAIDPGNEAIQLASELRRLGAGVLLIDWTLAGPRLLHWINTAGAASLADLIADRAAFDDILVPLADTNVQYVFATDVPDQRQLLDEDGLNLILDALDEAYDHVVIVGRYTDSKVLFETIQGRFDAGLTVAETTASPAAPPNDRFLGFGVADIEIMHYVRPAHRMKFDREAAARVHDTRQPA